MSELQSIKTIGRGSQPAAVDERRVGKGLVTLFALVLGLLGLTLPATAAADFGIAGFSDEYLNQSGQPETQAGAHPFVAKNVITVELDGMSPSGLLKEAVVDTPLGFVGDPSELPTCTTAELAILECPVSSQIGIFDLSTPSGSFAQGVYNMEVPDGQPARFGTPVFLGSALVYFDASIRPDDHGITVISSDVSHLLPIAATELRLWGVPADPAHDAERFLPGGTMQQGAPSSAPEVPFLTMPTSCGAPLTSGLRATSWDTPDVWVEDSYLGPVMEGCEDLDFQPGVKVQPHHTIADTPSAYTVQVTQQLTEAAESLVTSHLKDATVALPEGVAINPATADGLASCTEAEFGLGQAGAPACPAASQVGQVRIETPTLNEPLVGPVFQAAQGDNPFGSLLALYMAPVSERYGVRIKLAGEVKTDPVTGRLTSSFLENPQLPFSKLTLTLKGGNRAVLVNPPTCGAKTTDWSISPWARPGEAVTGGDTFEITTGPKGQPCPASVEQRGFAPEFEAGTVNAAAGSYSPFVLRLGREDGQQEVRDLAVTLPEGLTAKLAGIPYCPDATLAALAAGGGTSGVPGQPAANTAPGSAGGELAASACPAASQVGVVTIGSGAGPAPFYLRPFGGGSDASGQAYLAGPYKGAPLSLAIVTPVLAGPLDLGVVMIRSAIRLHERTAQITVTSDEIPTILEGIPLRIRDLRVVMDREQFTVNPTNCRARQVTAQIGGSDGARANVASRFQVGDCAALAFSPRFGARILDRGRRSTLRSFNPRVRFTVRPRAGQANLGPTRVTLPRSVILDQSHIRTVCTRPQFEARNCPEASIYGYARAWSPLLDKPVQGPVYLGSSDNKLPDLIADMDGQVRIVLQGRIDAAPGGRIRNTFPQVPDVPVSRFELTMRGGNRGILVNSTDLCRDTTRGVAVFRGQNGKRAVIRPRIGLSFKRCAQVRKRVARKKAQRKAQRRVVAAAARN